MIEAYADIAKEYPDSKLVIIAPASLDQHTSSEKKKIKTTQEHIAANFLNKQTIWIDPVSNKELKTWMSIARK